MDNMKQALQLAAKRSFAEKGYKATSISDICRNAHVAVGSFYNCYPSKEAIFLEIYTEENNRIRAEMVNEIDWSADPTEVIPTIFDYIFKRMSANRILSEWNSPAIGKRLREHYRAGDGKEDFFLHFLLATFESWMRDAGFDEEKSRKVLRACELVIYVDTHVTEKDFPGVGQALETLAAYFVKGLF